MKITKPFRILSLDGGGVRGAFTATLIARLEQACPGFVDRADLLAGTSTGSIIALMLSAGYPPDLIKKSYEEFCPEIFAPRKNAIPFAANFPFSNFTQAKYDPAPLEGF